VSLRRKVARVLRSFGSRLARAEGAVGDMLEIGTDLKEVAAELRETADRLQAAVVEQGRTLRDQMATVRDERERRAGLGRQVLELEHRLGKLEELRPANGAAE
jgi:hypothetical protein